MVCSLTDFDQVCDILTARPDRRTGPMLLRNAVRSVVVHRPQASTVEIELLDGTRLEEVAIEALFEIASGAIHLPSRGFIRSSSPTQTARPPTIR